MTGDTEEPKIIIDEDWKSQVQAEKEALERLAAEKKQAEQRAESKPAAAAGPPRSAPLPPASLAGLVSMLATQATMALGAIENPLTGEHEVDLEQARHFIDLLQLLEDKTAGNRTEPESALLSRLLDDLRLGYVAVKDAPAAPSTASR